MMSFSKLLRIGREGTLATALAVGMLTAPIAVQPAHAGIGDTLKKVSRWAPTVITTVSSVASQVGSLANPKTAGGKMALGGILTSVAPMLAMVIPPPAGPIAGAVAALAGIGLTFWGRHQMKKEAEALANAPVPNVPDGIDVGNGGRIGSERPTPGGSGIPGGNGSGSGGNVPSGNGASSGGDNGTGISAGGRGNGSGSERPIPGGSGIPVIPGNGTESTGNGASSGSDAGRDDDTTGFPVDIGTILEGIGRIGDLAGNGSSSTGSGNDSTGDTSIADPRTPVGIDRNVRPGGREIATPNGSNGSPNGTSGPSPNGNVGSESTVGNGIGSNIGRNDHTRITREDVRARGRVPSARRADGSIGGGQPR